MDGKKERRALGEEEEARSGGSKASEGNLDKNSDLNSNTIINDQPTDQIKQLNEGNSQLSQNNNVLLNKMKTVKEGEGGEGGKKFHLGSVEEGLKLTYSYK